MTDIEIFTEYYRCKIEPTDRRSFFGPMNIVQVGSGPLPKELLESVPIVGVYLTEDMLTDLIKTNVERIKEEQIRNRDTRLKKLYTEYITWLNLIR